MDDRWWSVDEMCTYLDVSRDAVHKWIEQKGLPVSHVTIHTPGLIIEVRDHDVDGVERERPWTGEHGDRCVRYFAGLARPPAAGPSVEYNSRTDVSWKEQRTLWQNDNAPGGPDNLPLVVCPNGPG